VPDATGETTELLQTLVRNACVNDGSPESGQEIRSATTLADHLGGAGVDFEVLESAPGRASLVARLEGREPGAPSLCLMGHTDVVPVDPAGWSRDPFGGELVDGELWGRGAVDMLNLTAAMAVAFRTLAAEGFRPRGDLVFLAVADEESGSRYGAQWLAEHHWDAIAADYVLTEGGGIHRGPPGGRVVTFNVAEKGVAWRRLTVRGEPGHGSMPHGVDNALVQAAEVVRRLAAYSPRAAIHDLWSDHVAGLDLDPAVRHRLADAETLDAALDDVEDPGLARHLHACSHTTVSCNAVHGDFKTNVIPGAVTLEVDVRTLPGETAADADAHLEAALGPLARRVEVSPILDWEPSVSPGDTPLWASIGRAVARAFPGSRPAPQLHMGFTDARIYRQRGAVAYGAGLFDPSLEAGEFARRFHGDDERVDVASLGLTTELFLDVARDFLA
jgi:acetylornithine deacetylase/succinyl-diaminopimelate desuccinylase-like protein